MPTRSRVTAVLTLTATLVAAAAVLAGGAANAAADAIIIRTPVAIIALGGAGGERLAVTADSTTPVATMTVRLLNAVRGTDALSLTMTPPAGGAKAGTSTWTSGAITPDVLPLGDYLLTVDAADEGDAMVTGVPAGMLPFQDTPRIAQAAGDYVISGTNKHPLIDGTITELAPGASTPIPYANQPIVLHDPVEGDIDLTTNGAGAYREALPEPAAGETVTAEILPTATTRATAARPVTLTVRTAITGFQANLNPYGQVGVHGCLRLAPGTAGRVPSLADVTIAYSVGQHGPWHTLGTVAAQRGSSGCGDGRTFTGVLPARVSGAYYRASYPAASASTDTSGGYLPSVSASVHAWRHITRITHFTVSARTIRKGGKLTTSGRLQFYSGHEWHVLPHRLVQIILLPRGSRTWYWIARVTTNATGEFTATFTDPVTATWSAEYLGGNAQLASVGAMIGVTLRR